MKQKELNEKILRLNFWEKYHIIPTFEQMEVMML